MNNKNDSNEKELSFLKKELGIENPSPDQLRNALKELSSRKIISNFTIKKDK
jgi:signal recognition particle subunit SEC65